MANLKDVGETTPGIWSQISQQGFLNDFPDAEFRIIKKNTRFPELSVGVISVREEDAKRFLEIKKEQTKLNGGNWIIS